MDGIKTCCFTGHRDIAEPERQAVVERLPYVVRGFIGDGYTRFLCGGALGFDTLAAYAVLEARKANPAIQLVIVQPYADQDAEWSAAAQAEYRALLGTADEVVCLAPEYYEGCMKARNAYLTDHADACVAYLKRPRSGTSQTVGMAKKRGLELLNIVSDCSCFWPVN